MRLAFYHFQHWLLTASIFLTHISPIKADCNTYTPAFPLPKLDKSSPIIRNASREIVLLLREAVAHPDFDTTAFSISITSSKQTLTTFHHTAREKDPSRPGATRVDGSSCFRIASCTKAFTVLALLQLEKAGKLNLDDPVNMYIPDLNEPQNGTLPWKDITLRTLASQLSGIPRDYGQNEQQVDLSDPIAAGFPPLTPSQHHEIQCDSVTNYTVPCTRNDLLSRVKNALPIFPPKQTSTYSNIGFELLGLVIESLTSTTYESHINTSILHPLNLTSTTFLRPLDSVAVLPKSTSKPYYWDVVMGQANPTGGLYSSSDDLAKFLRYILTHYNGLTPSVNWLAPISYATGMNTFYGMPWEIFRTSNLLSYTNRPVTFITKGGGLPGYTSIIATIPDYDLGFTILVAGNGALLTPLLDAVSTLVVRAADTIAQTDLAARYTGTWTAKHLNSSLTLSHSLPRGLYVSRWVSNGTDVLAQLGKIEFGISRDLATEGTWLQVVPTLLFMDEKAQKGERWRMIGHKERKGLWGDFCITDVDVGAYGGEPINEIVFWDQDGDGFGRVDLTGWRVRLFKDKEENGREEEDRMLVVQT